MEKMNYRKEIEHDWLLISLVKELDAQNRLDILNGPFSIQGKLGRLERAQRRQLFDVELKFDNLSIAIETKVDSDENGRWNGEWQTNNIVQNTNQNRYLFITYGTSEFYTKPYNSGPASPAFVHVRLNNIIELVDAADRVLPQCERRAEWLREMRREQTKRNNAVRLLQSFSQFRTQYLDIHGENDFPRNRLLFCAPELAFPVLHSLAQQWSGSEYAERFGKLSLYPVARLSPPVHDSILNFWELWKTGNPAVGVGIGGIDGRFYFEMNEDFNLNLKMDGDLNDNARKEVWRRLNQAKWPCFVHHHRRNYTQRVRVLYEIDFGFLRELNDMPRVMSNLANAVEAAIQALS